MADDIDELLDEIETKYISKKSDTEKNQKWKADSMHDDELQAALDDICTDESIKHSNRGSKRISSTSSLQIRCFPTILAGSTLPMGLASTSSTKACDALRCLQCDFKVLWFDNFSWSTDVDYLFLRNNMPDFQRLRPKLKPKKGDRAYACQCQWRSVGKLVDLQTDSTLKWICSKH